MRFYPITVSDALLIALIRDPYKETGQSSPVKAAE